MKFWKIFAIQCVESLYEFCCKYQEARGKYIVITAYKGVDLDVLVSQDEINKYWFVQIDLFSYIPTFEDAPFDGIFTRIPDLEV